LVELRRSTAHPAQGLVLPTTIRTIYLLQRQRRTHARFSTSAFKNQSHSRYHADPHDFIYSPCEQALAQQHTRDAYSPIDKPSSAGAMKSREGNDWSVHGSWNNRSGKRKDSLTMTSYELWKAFFCWKIFVLLLYLAADFFKN
jgi:hypothetical protein